MLDPFNFNRSQFSRLSLGRQRHRRQSGSVRQSSPPFLPPNCTTLQISVKFPFQNYSRSGCTAGVFFFKATVFARLSLFSNPPSSRSKLPCLPTMIFSWMNPSSAPFLSSWSPPPILSWCKPSCNTANHENMSPSNGPSSQRLTEPPPYPPTPPIPKLPHNTPNHPPPYKNPKKAVQKTPHPHPPHPPHPKPHNPSLSGSKSMFPLSILFVAFPCRRPRPFSPSRSSLDGPFCLGSRQKEGSPLSDQSSPLGTAPPIPF